MEILYDSSISSNYEFDIFMENKNIPQKVKDFIMNYLVDRIVLYKQNGNSFIYLLFQNERKKRTLKIKG